MDLALILTIILGVPGFTIAIIGLVKYFKRRLRRRRRPKRRRWLNLGQEIRKLRNVARLSQTALAARSGYDSRYIHKIESGQEKPTRQELIRVLQDGLKLNAAKTDEILYMAGYARVSTSTAEELGTGTIPALVLRDLHLPAEVECYSYEQARSEDSIQIDAVSGAAFRETVESSTWLERVREQMRVYPEGFRVAKVQIGSQTLVVGYAIYFPVKPQLFGTLSTAKGGYGDVNAHYILTSEAEQNSQTVDYCIESIVVLRQVPVFVSFNLLRWVQKEIRKKANVRRVFTVSVTPEGDDMADLFGMRFVRTIAEKEGETQRLWNIQIQ